MSRWTVTFRGEGSVTVEAATERDAIVPAIEAMERKMRVAGRSRQDIDDFIDYPTRESVVEA